MPPISAVIITFNEEKNIARCLNSLKGLADEIIVVDSFSTDNTREICKEHQVKFIEREFISYSDQKNWANSQTQYQYVITLDADEALSDALKNSILSEKDTLKYDAYSFKRLTNFCGKWIKHTGWYPDKKIRIFNKNKIKWDNKIIHEDLLFDSNDIKIKQLEGNLLHYSYYTIDEHIRQINKFSSLKAEALFKKGKKASCIKIFLDPIATFFRLYLIRMGFLDGFYGFVISVNSAHSTFLKYTKLKSLYKQKKLQ